MAINARLSSLLPSKKTSGTPQTTTTTTNTTNPPTTTTTPNARPSTTTPHLSPTCPYLSRPANATLPTTVRREHKPQRNRNRNALYTNLNANARITAESEACAVTLLEQSIGVRDFQIEEDAKKMPGQQAKWLVKARRWAEAANCVETAVEESDEVSVRDRKGKGRARR